MLLQHHSSKASILRHSTFFTVQLSHPYMTTGKARGPAEAPLSGQAVELRRWAAAGGRCGRGGAAPGWAEPLPQTLQTSRPRAALRAPLTGRCWRSGPQHGTTPSAPHLGPSTAPHSTPLPTPLARPRFPGTERRVAPAPGYGLWASSAEHRGKVRAGVRERGAGTPAGDAGWRRLASAAVARGSG